MDLKIEQLPARVFQTTAKGFPYYHEGDMIYKGDRKYYNSIVQYVTFHCPRTATGHGFLSFNDKTFRSPPIVFTNKREKKVECKIKL